MSDDPRRLTTDEERERLRVARRRGGLCGLCGRTLAADEPVYVERVRVMLRPFMVASARRSLGAVNWNVPVGAECAAPEFVRRTEGWATERCAGCGRPVYYEAGRAGRRQTSCSKRCANIAGRAGKTE